MMWCAGVARGAGAMAGCGVGWWRWIGRGGAGGWVSGVDGA